jgi:SWI/SNF-related matrix-associated actin-dependent regulator of chromatin subfamily A member 5
LEEERQAAQDFIDTGMFNIVDPGTGLISQIVAEPLTEEEMTLKESYIEQGFPDWSRRDFQQFVRALEAYGWYVVVPKAVRSP